MNRLALEGIRVLDFSSYWAGTSPSRFMVPMGAQVIKIESRRHPDGSRLMPPSVDGVGGLNRGAMFYELNAGKLGLSLDLTKPKAVDLVKQLVKVSDIVTENYVPGVMTKLGTDYSALRAVKEDIIMLSISGYGATGPDKDNVAFADPIMAAVGIPLFTGYIDGPPAWIGLPFLDLVAGLHGAVALLAALEYRSRVGKGQHIEMSMAEAGLCFAPEGLMEYIMNKRTRPRMGNRDDVMVPHGCYRCRGEDKWVAIAVGTTEEWEAFCKATGNSPWAQDDRFCDAFRRRQNQDELDRLIEQWTINYDPYEIMHILQAAGVAAAPVFNIEEIINDPHIKDRGLYVEVNQPETGKMLITGLPLKMSGAVNKFPHAPEMGEHNEDVLSGILGLSKEEIESLEREGILD